MLGSSTFLLLWRVIPPYLPQRWALYIRLIVMVVISLSFWALFATTLFFIVRLAAGVEGPIWPVITMGVLALIVNVLVS